MRKNVGMIGTYSDGKELERSLKYGREKRSIADLEATIGKAERGKKITAVEEKRAGAALS